MKNYCVILASGTGSRFVGNVPKQFEKICGRMIVEYTLRSCDCGIFDELVLVVPPSYVEPMQMAVGLGHYAVPVKVVAGGGTRKASCELGVAAISDSDEDVCVCIHNGVQPFVSKDTFLQCLSALELYPAVTSGAPCVFTVLETDGNGVLERMPSRSRCFCDLGPECFRLSLLRKVLDVGTADSELTNLTGIVAKHGLGRVYVVPGDPRNFKITYHDDLVLAERIIEQLGNR